MTTVLASRTAESILTDDMLARFHARAPIYDRENPFFQEDFEELRKAGYLTIAVPEEFGGLGLTLAQVIRQQRRLAYRAPATALAVNMHVYWTGLAADLRRLGDTSLDWLLREAAAGEVFAAGHAETGNDLPVLLSSSKAERVDGGYRFSGHKMFGSLSPVWTRLGIHGMDASDPAAPKVVHAFVPRGTPGYVVKETWDTLGMRATRSDDTILDGVFVPDRYIARVVPAGAIDPFVGGIFAWALLNFGGIYYAIAERARDLAITSARKRTSLGLSRSMAYHPEIQHLFSQMQLEIESMGPHLEKIADDWSTGVDHGAAWPMKIVAAKYHCAESAKRVVDLALTSSGGGGMFKSSELERLYRDVRCGGFPPGQHHVDARDRRQDDPRHRPRRTAALGLKTRGASPPKLAQPQKYINIQPRAEAAFLGTRYIGAVPLFMDIHRKVEGLTPEAVRAAHQKDLEVQGRSGVRFIRYWYDEKAGKVFCLSEAPNAEAVNAAHREAHGLLADEVIEVAEGT